jgi:hypothetical protein
MSGEPNCYETLDLVKRIYVENNSSALEASHYLLHSSSTMQLVGFVGTVCGTVYGDTVLKVTALYPAVERKLITIDQLMKLGYSNEITHILELFVLPTGEEQGCLTKQTIDRIIASGNVLAMLIKAMDIFSSPGFDSGRYEFYRYTYRRLMNSFCGELCLSYEQRETLSYFIEPF